MSEKVLRVLQVYPQMNNAGTEKVIMSLYANMEQDKVQFDFLTETPGELDEKIRSMGGQIYYIENKGKKSYYQELLLFFQEHPEYSIVHTHTHAAMGTVLKAAQKSGIPCRIAHSHNARNDLPKFMWFIKGLTSVELEQCATQFFACSKNAAKWLFPHKQKATEVVYNGIPVERYLFSEENRRERRAECGFSEDTPVVIHVGRFARQKNHTFLADVLKELDSQTEGKARTLLIGVGPLQDEIKAKLKEAGLSEKVIFLNNRTDVEKWLSAGDMFVFPSLHEGLGIVVIEAQASGLPCVVSDAVPQEADMNLGLLHTLTLKDSAAVWAGKALEVYQNRKNRAEYEERIFSGHYNIKNIAMKMQQFYLENGVK